MKCRDFERRMSLYISDELDGEMRLACEEHVRSCGRCARLADEHRRVSVALARSARDEALQVQEPLPDLEGAVLRRVTAKNRERTDQVGRGRPPRLAWAVSVGLNLLLAGVLIGQWMGRSGGGGPQPVAAGSVAYSDASLDKMFTEMEALYGDRLAWVAARGAEVDMGIIHDAADVPAGADSQGEGCAVVVRLSPVSDGQGAKGATAAILMREGASVRYVSAAPDGGVTMRLDIRRPRRVGGRLTFDMDLTAAAPEAREGVARATLTANAALVIGHTVKIGQVRVGATLYDVLVTGRGIASRSGRGAGPTV